MAVEKFASSGARMAGGLGAAVGLVALAAMLNDGALTDSIGWTLFFVLLVVGSWATLLRPQLRLADDSLVLVNTIDTITIPLVAIDSIEVRRMVVVRAGGKRYLCPAVSRSMKDLVKEGMAGSRNPTHMPNFIEDRVHARVKEAREFAGAGDAVVRRRWAWFEIALVVVPAVALVIVLLPL